MTNETLGSREGGARTFTTKEELMEFILGNVQRFTNEDFDKPQGEDENSRTTLREFLNQARDGSEFTDEHQFKIKIKDGQFIFERT